MSNKSDAGMLKNMLKNNIFLTCTRFKVYSRITQTSTVIFTLNKHFYNYSLFNDKCRIVTKTKPNDALFISAVLL